MPLAKSPSPARPISTRVALVLVALLTVAVVGVVAFSVGRLSTLGNPEPSTTSAEAGFARDMQVHHDQGVELALLIRDRSADPDVRLLAYDVARTQSQQSGQLYGWLTQWGLPQAASEPAMTWMTRPGRTTSEHGHSADAMPARMPGLATPKQIADLTAESGTPADRQFLTLMIAHHKGAIEMADAVLDRSENDSVRGFATSVVTSQESEVTLMQEMLAALP